MLNTHGRAGVVVLTMILIIAAVSSGVWYAVNKGWSGTPAGTWSGFRAMIASDSGRPAESSAAKIDSKPVLPSADKSALPPGLPQTAESGQNPAVSEPAVSGSVQNPAPASTGQSGAAPASVLKACIERLKLDDVIGAEQYVSENGMRYTVGSTVGVHEVLWKGLYRLHAYDGVDYDRAKLSGQTAWVPVYTNLGQGRMITAYAVLANRGDGWKLDHLCDERKY